MTPTGMSSCTKSSQDVYMYLHINIRKPYDTIIL